MPDHDTRAFDAVGGAVQICPVHEQVSENIFAAIDQRLSKAHAAILVSVAAVLSMAFGGMIWTMCTNTKEDVTQIERRTAIIEVKLEHIQAAQADAKQELARLREEQRQQYEHLRELIKNGGH